MAMLLILKTVVMLMMTTMNMPDMVRRRRRRRSRRSECCSDAPARQPVRASRDCWSCTAGPVGWYAEAAAGAEGDSPRTSRIDEYITKRDIGDSLSYGRIPDPPQQSARHLKPIPTSLRDALQLVTLGTQTGSNACVRMYVCMYVRRYVCMYVCTY